MSKQPSEPELFPGEMVDPASEEAAPEPASTALMGYQEQPEFESGDVFIPNLRLAQGLTPEVQEGEAKPGQWVVLGFPPEGEVTVVPLLYKKTHQHKDEDTKEVTPCDDPACPLREWTDDPDNEGKRLPPKCATVFNYVVYSVTHDVLATLRFSRTSERAGKIMNTAIARSGLGNVAILLKAKQQQGPNGNFFVPITSAVKADESVLRNAAARLAKGV